LYRWPLDCLRRPSTTWYKPWKEREVPRRSSRTPDKPKDFYEEALSQAERVRLSRAKQVQGLDEEIALLRVRLSRLAEEQPENLELLIKGIGMLVRAVSTKYKLSHKAEEDLYQSLLGVLRGVGSVLLPEGFNG
jgi:hypothetical protein